MIEWLIFNFFLSKLPLPLPISYTLHGNQDITATALNQSGSLCRLLKLSLPMRLKKNGSPSSLIHHIKKSSFTNIESAVITPRSEDTLNTEEYNYRIKSEIICATGKWNTFFFLLHLRVAHIISLKILLYLSDLRKVYSI